MMEMDIRNKMNTINYNLRPVKVSEISEDVNYLRYSEDLNRRCLDHLTGSFIAYHDEKIVCAAKCNLETTAEKIKGIVPKGKILLIKVGERDTAYLMNKF